MDEPEKRELCAQMMADGNTRDQIAAAFGVNKDTISDWRKRADVQALISKIINDRSNRILSVIDNKIEGYLSQADKLGLDDLIKIRKEFAATKTETVIRVDQAGALEDLITRANSDPAFAAALDALPDGSGS